jgi:hypothetical protein
MTSEVEQRSAPVSADPARIADVAHGALRGAVAAMAMTGMRAFTVNAGIVEQPPPQAIIRQRVPGMGRFGVRRKRRRVVEELFHWGYGAGGGAAFAVLPEPVRRRTWAGPAYGLAIWLGFEVAIAPVLGLKQARQLRLMERAALAADHLLYGFVLTETRRRTSR